MGRARRLCWRIALVAAVAAIALGSMISLADESPSPATFHDVAPIFERRCQRCHRPGDIAPFSLQTYQEARPWARSIREAVAKRRMPPWFADPSIGRYLDDPSLTEEEIRRIVQWADAGALEGEPSPLPPAAAASPGFALGEPDMTLEMEAAFSVAPGEDAHRCFLLPESELRQSRFLAAAEVLPGNRRIVHHAVAYLVATESARRKDAATPGPGWDCFTGTEVEGGEAGIVVAWAPGNPPLRWTSEIEPLVPAGASIVLGVHYHPIDSAQSDRTRLGLWFASAPPKRLPQVHGITARQFALPAGESAVAVEASYRVPRPIHLLGFFPHMHYLGKDQTVWAEYPDGRKEVIFGLRAWDMNWQLLYRPSTPPAIPAGTVLRTIGRFDNSAANPANPNRPPQTVRWGRESTGEMMDTYFFFTADEEELTPERIERLTARPVGRGLPEVDAVSKAAAKAPPERNSAESPDRSAEFTKLERQLLAELGEAERRADRSAIAGSLTSLGHLYRSAGRSADARRRYERVIELWEEAAGPDCPELGPALNNLAMTYYSEERYAEAEALYRRSLTVNEKALGPDHPDLAPVANNLSFLYRTVGKYAEAEDYGARVVAIAEKALGPAHDLVASSAANLAGLHGLQKNYAEAERLYRRALGIWNKNGKMTTAETASAFEGFAVVLEQTGREADAAKARSLARSIRQRLASPGAR